MGKGRGGGRGKGGCDCCEAIHALACCLCLVLFGGPILIAVGAVLIQSANRNDRARSIGKVEDAVERWNDGNNPDGWNQFQNLSLYARFTPTISSPSCNVVVSKLVIDLVNPDQYKDEAGRFSWVTQRRLTAALDKYGDFINCIMTVNITQQLASGGNGSMIFLPAMSRSTLSYSILLDQADGPRRCPTRNDGCLSGNAANCRSNCEDYFYGKWSCSSSNFKCYISGMYFTNFAVKVAFKSAAGSSPAGYYLDNVKPGVGGGANVLWSGFVRDFDTSNLPNTVITGPLFQLPNVPLGIRPSPSQPPSMFSVTVRSSADPWLTYMEATSGTGYFGVTKSALMATGVTLVVIGSLGTLLWIVAAFYAWWLLCSRRKPTSRPAGVSGYAWDLANRYGGQYAPALGVPVHGTGQDGVPTAQPLYVPQGPYGNQQVPGQPVAGYPQYAYPQTYGAPQPGTYAPYAYPAGYPGAPGASIEMNQFANVQPPPYGYQAAPPAGTTPDGRQGAPAQYAPPYHYPYPQYGGSPPPPPAGTGTGPPPPPPPADTGATTVQRPVPSHSEPPATRI